MIEVNYLFSVDGETKLSDKKVCGRVGLGLIIYFPDSGRQNGVCELNLRYGC